jgi:uncharacterized protein
VCESLGMVFPVSGVQISPLILPAAAFCISLLTSMGGISGGVVLLPFQISVLGFVGPAVTPTNHLFNVVAIPSGVYRYLREGRMVWPLTLVILLGTIPGVVLGSLARVRYLPDPRHFKLFVGVVLLLIGLRLVQRALTARGAPPAAENPRVHLRRFDLRRLEYDFAGQILSVSCPALVLLTLAVGVVGGAYGVGGGALLAPFLVSIFGLPVHSIAGATLGGTWVTSLVAIVAYLGQPLVGQPAVAPDWALGGLLGAGGLVGMYCGARLQRRVPARAIEAIIAVIVCSVGGLYLIGFARS